MLELNIYDFWNVDGDRELSYAWSGSTRFTVLCEKSTDGCTWSRKKLARKQTTSRPDTVRPEIWKYMSEASKRIEKQKWAIEKRKLDNGGQSHDIDFIDPDDEEFNEIFKKKTRRKFKVPMPAAMLCKTRGREFGETCSVPGICKIKVRTSLKPTNLRESAWKELFKKVMKIILQGKESTH